VCSADSVGIADDGVTGEESCRGVVAGGDMIEGRVGGTMLGGSGSETGSLEVANG
jgi:hypothetical protein